MYFLAHKKASLRTGGCDSSSRELTAGSSQKRRRRKEGRKEERIKGRKDRKRLKESKRLIQGPTTSKGVGLTVNPAGPVVCPGMLLSQAPRHLLKCKFLISSPDLEIYT
jgi:hypothetical protein